jgi:Schlafen, AlbA_2
VFGTPITQLNYDSVLRFLEAGFREGFILDYKSDFPAHLDRILAAFANTSGGVVLIGVEETPTGAGKAPPKGVELRPGLRERVLRTGLDAVYPPVIPEVHVVEFNAADPNAHPDRAVIVVRVHESDQTPHTVDGRTAIYLRTDNVSTRFLRKAALEEIEWLVNKREKSLVERERILKLVETHAIVHRERRAKQPSNLPLRHKSRFAFYTVPHYPRSVLAGARELMAMAAKNTVHIPAVPHTLPSGSPMPVTEGVIFESGSGTTEFQQQGMIYQSIDFWWDYAVPAPRGERFVLPGATAAFLWGMLELAQLTYGSVGFAGLVDMEFRLEGVRDALFRDPQRFDLPCHPICDDVIAVRRTHTVSELRDRTLEIATGCQRELYWACSINAGDGLLKKDFANCG